MHFLIAASTDHARIGVYPQCPSMIAGYNFDQAQSVDNICDWAGAEKSATVDGFLLDREARLTDVLSSPMAPLGMLFSTRALHVIEEGVGYRLTAAPCIVHEGRNSHRYHALCISHQDLISFRESRFRLYRDGVLIENGLSMPSREAYDRYSNELALRNDGLFDVLPDALALTSEHEIPKVFSLPIFGLGFYAAEDIVQALDKNQVSGWTAKRSPFGIFRPTQGVR